MRVFRRRFMFYVITFWAAVTINFLIPRLLPGDPVSALIAKNQGRISPDATEALRALSSASTRTCRSGSSTSTTGD